MSTNEAVTILFRGGRLATWHRLPAQQKRAIEQEHVDLMLGIAIQHNLRRLEGFRLITPQGGWERSWIVQFLTLAGAEAWIEAEMAPPYGRYGFYDYHLARQVQASDSTEWLHDIINNVAVSAADPHQVPDLAVDKESVVVFLYQGGKLGNGLVPNELAAVPTRAKMHGVTRLESFNLIAPTADWDRVWLAELPTIDSAEAWIEAEAAAGQSDTTTRHFQLARKWAPDYFRSWIPR